MTEQKKRMGRPKKPATPGERVSLGLRVTAGVKERLDRAADSSGRSQSQEAEIRLERSFSEEDGFGGPEILDMARLMAHAFNLGGKRGALTKGHPRWTPARWMNDPFCYESAIRSAINVLRASMPESGPDDVRKMLTSFAAENVARGLPYKIRRLREKEEES